MATGVAGLPRAGRGRAGFTAFAGTAIGLRGVETPGLGKDTAGGMVGEAAVWAIPVLGIGLRLIFSAWRAAVAGAGAMSWRGALLLSMAATIFSAVRVRWSIF